MQIVLENIRSNKKTLYILGLIFLLALIVRFFYFPGDIYFAYDQARDAYISLKAISGDIKIVGPPATFKGINHGALFYYLFGFFLFLSNKSPVPLAGFMRIYNALGVFLIFAVVSLLFKSKRAGFIGAFIYAMSFEQTQYALFLGHPALAILSVLLFYLGLTLLVFAKRKLGYLFSLLGLGLSVQFHFSMINLLIVFVLILLVFRKNLPKPDIKIIFWSIVVFLLSIGTYILAEFKFGFSTTKAIVNFFTSSGSSSFYLNNLYIVGQRFVKENFFSLKYTAPIIFVLYTVLLALMLLVKKTKNTSLFLAIWLFAGLIPYSLGKAAVTVYYYSIGGSLSLVILTAYVIDRLLEKKRGRLLGYSILLAIALSNIDLIKDYNPYGTIPEINVQDRMLLSDEKKVLSFIYNEAEEKNFSVNALTVPYNINTTWSYLFEWYGKDKYGYLPTWGGDAAAGFEGGLNVVTFQSELPNLRFSIFEPPRGLPGHLIDEFTLNEDRFWKLEKETRFGEIKVQKRIRK